MVENTPIVAQGKTTHSDLIEQDIET